jgi:fermentation-respiration switch protein FrsA (DUF1100 family)
VLSVTPEDALIDVARRISVSALSPGEEVVLRTRTVRGTDVVWRSAATFHADARGEIDLQRDAPVSGSYAGVSAMGLVWSQAPEQPGAPRDVFAAEPAALLSTEIMVQRHGAPVLRGRLVQRLAGRSVTRHELREDGLAGTLFVPPERADGRAHPAVLVLNGSGGGLNEPRAALYASHGYAALALGYFKTPGLPDYISNTPLEYFETALAWLHRRVRPWRGFVAVSGQSRGGELALLLASLFPVARLGRDRLCARGAGAQRAERLRPEDRPRRAGVALPRAASAASVARQSHRHLGSVGRRPTAASPRRGTADGPSRPRCGGARAHPRREHPRPGAAAVGHR